MQQEKAVNLNNPNLLRLVVQNRIHLQIQTFLRQQQNIHEHNFDLFLRIILLIHHSPPLRQPRRMDSYQEHHHCLRSHKINHRQEYNILSTIQRVHDPVSQQHHHISLPQLDLNPSRLFYRFLLQFDYNNNREVYIFSIVQINSFT